MTVDQLLRGKIEKRKLSEDLKEKEVNSDEERRKENKRQIVYERRKKMIRNNRKDEYLNRQNLFERMKPKSFYV